MFTRVKLRELLIFQTRVQAEKYLFLIRELHRYSMRSDVVMIPIQATSILVPIPKHTELMRNYEQNWEIFENFCCKEYTFLSCSLQQWFSEYLNYSSLSSDFYSNSVFMEQGP